MAATDDAATHARAFHDDGFVVLNRAQYGLSNDQVKKVAAAVRARYDQLMAVAASNNIDLLETVNAERIPGFYVREGGRIDMQLVSLLSQRHLIDLPDAHAVVQRLVADVAPVDSALFRCLETHWTSITDAIFATTPYELEYIGCVIARPGDGDQNWHLDGVHRNLTQHEPADRLNVFVPLVDINEETGGTEMKRRSQFHDNGARGAAFKGYADLESATPYVAAGTPIVMDYRVWHRGLANTSTSELRPLLYFKYTLRQEPSASKRPSETGASARKKKRVALVTVAEKPNGL